MALIPIALLVIAALCLVLGIVFGVKLGFKRNLIRIFITLALAALAIWLLVDSAVEFTQDTRDDIPATEP